MNQQERDLLTNLTDRLRNAPPVEKDTEADQMIGALVRERPDTPYVLAQTVLIQDYTLTQAQARISELEQQLQHSRANQGGGSFLGAIFGSGRDSPPQQQQAVYQQPQQPASQPGYAPAAGPWGAAPMAGQPSFLRSAATTAAGIAGGALLFQGIQSLLGGGHASFGNYASYGGLTPQPALTETTVNNYYDTPAPGTHSADYQPGSDDNSGVQDVSYDGGDFDSGDDFGGTDV